MSEQKRAGAWGVMRVWPGVVLALAFAVGFYWWWPTDLVADDTGIILKYMDNFARGHFYTYNVGDGPVFGISSFLHGVLAGAIAASGLLSPLSSLFASNFIGLVLLGAALYAVLRRFTPDELTAAAAWLALMLAAPNLVVNYRQGLETTLHTGLLLLAFAAYLHRRPRLLWAAGALAIIAKLDSLPIVAVLLGAAWLRDLPASASRPALLASARQAGLLFVLPLSIWSTFCVAVFGSVLPQSAYSKLFFAPHGAGSWFPFLGGLLADRTGQILMGLFLITMVAVPVICVARGRPRDCFDYMIFGAAWFAHMALYYVYNPAERHPWYYAIPELLLRLQIVAPALALGALLPRLGRAAALGLVVAFAALTWPAVRDHTALTIHLLEVIEAERVEAGRWIGAHSDPDDRLFTGYGHFARESGLYTIDYSGLNSKIVTAYGRDRDRLMRDLRPEWTVGHGLLASEAEREFGYRLRLSRYNITTVGLPAWRIYERVPAAEWAETSPVRPEQVSAASVSPADHALLVSGAQVELTGLDPAACRVELDLGLRRGPQDARVTMELRGPDGAPLTRAELDLPAYVPGQPVGLYTLPWQVALDPDWRIASAVISARDQAGRPLTVDVIDPLFLERPCR